MIVFGPVPSRRFGRSLGINNIPAKICTYGCVYCQLGRTIVKSVARKPYYSTDEIYRDAVKKVEEAEENGIEIDYLTFVPDGEPTLDLNLGKEAEMLKDIGIKIAIITNSSLIWMEDVRSSLMGFDAVSLKVDAVNEGIWRKVDRPHESLSLSDILAGILEFSDEFKGSLLTETMLIDGVDYSEEGEKIANFLKDVHPEKAYISIPTRPPAENWVRPPSERVMNEVYQAYRSGLGNRVEYLIEYEGNYFSGTGEVEDDILSITSVHPMREEAVEKFLKERGKDMEVVNRLMAEGKLISIEYQGKKYFMRRIASRY